MKRVAGILLLMSGSCAGDSNAGLLAKTGCPFCTPGAEDGVCVDACPPGGSAYGDSPGSHCDFGPSCATGLSVCGGGSFPCLATDPSNCGTCGHACGTGQQCIDANCGTSCGGSFAQLETDPSNCGSCGNVCSQGQVCAAGVCGSPCAPTSSQCTGMWASLPDGGLNCPTCPSCTLGYVPFPTCVDVTSDSNNCGACGTVCGLGEICNTGNCEPACAAGQVCGGGSCQASCPAGTSACPGTKGGSMVCVDFRNDANNCGSCGNASQPASAVAASWPAGTTPTADPSSRP